MKILVTGGSGFIGGNFILKQIKYKNNQILNFDKLTYAGNLETLKAIEDYDNYSFIKGDICDKKLLNFHIEKFKPNLIVNFAAESHVDRSINGPFEFIQTNIVGTASLLDTANYYYKKLSDKDKSKFRLLHISTDEVYGSLGESGLFTESTAYDPSSPYSASKASSDHLVRSWYRTYGLPILITNCSNNYGPYQFPEKLIPLMIINCILKKQLPIYGNGENVRDWIFVEDHCDAIMEVLLNGDIGETYNIGGSNEISNINIVRKICEIMNKVIPMSNNRKYQDLITYVPDRPGHDFRYAIDSNKIKNSVNWLPKENFETGIYKTINWYIANSSWWKPILQNKYQQQRLGVIK